MEPFCHQTTAKKSQPNILSACIPFFDLREHNHQTDAKLTLGLIEKLRAQSTSSDGSGVQPCTSSDTTHPMCTLFQSLNPRNNSRRDLKQVVCQMLEPKDRRYLYLSQVWFLVINEGNTPRMFGMAIADAHVELIITCSVLAEDELLGDLLQRSTTAKGKLPMRGILNIHLETPDGNNWIFEHADCSTYLVGRTNGCRAATALTERCA